MPYKDIEKRLEWARNKYAKDERTRKLTRLRTLRRKIKMKILGKVKWYTPKKGDWNFYKSQARYAVRNAINTGKLTRLPCRTCGEIKSQAHHEDYSKPLEVAWLCAKHHMELHRRCNLNKKALMS